MGKFDKIDSRSNGKDLADLTNQLFQETLTNRKWTSALREIARQTSSDSVSLYQMRLRFDVDEFMKYRVCFNFGRNSDFLGQNLRSKAYLKLLKKRIVIDEVRVDLEKNIGTSQTRDDVGNSVRFQRILMRIGIVDQNLYFVEFLGKLHSDELGNPISSFEVALKGLVETFLTTKGEAPISNENFLLDSSNRTESDNVSAVDPGSIDNRDFRERYELTNAESRVVDHLAAGLSVGEIAATTKTKVSTIRTHLHRIYQKTETKGQVELILQLNRSRNVAK